MRGIVFSGGTSEENYQAAFDLDGVVFPVVYPNGAPGTTRYADPVRHPNGSTWAYPADEVSEPILVAAEQGPIVELTQSEWFPPPPMPE